MKNRILLFTLILIIIANCLFASGRKKKYKLSVIESIKGTSDSIYSVGDIIVDSIWLAEDKFIYYKPNEQDNDDTNGSFYLGTNKENNTKCRFVIKNYSKVYYKKLTEKACSWFNNKKELERKKELEKRESEKIAREKNIQKIEYPDNTTRIDNKYKRQSLLNWVSSQGGYSWDRYNKQFNQSEKFKISSRNFDIIFYYGGQIPSNNSKVSGCWIGFNNGFGSKNEIYKIQSELENSGVIPFGLNVSIQSAFGCIEADIGDTNYDN